MEIRYIRQREINTNKAATEMESINDLTLEFEDNPYLKYSVKELLKMMRK